MYEILDIHYNDVYKVCFVHTSTMAQWIIDSFKKSGALPLAYTQTTGYSTIYTHTHSLYLAIRKFTC